jgi:glutathione synthase
MVADARSQKPQWTTTHLALAALRRGHDVAMVAADELTLQPDNRVTARVLRPAGDTATSPEALSAALAADDVEGREESIGGFDVLFLRYHPRRERGGVHSPALDFGWRLRLGDTLVVNDPEGTQRAGERVYVAGLPAEIRPRMLVTRELSRVKAFLAELGTPAVVKPLTEVHGDAENIFYLGQAQSKNLNQILSVVRKTGYMVVQEYLPEVAEGEKRLLLLGGEPIRGPGGQVAIYKRWPDPGWAPDAGEGKHGRREPTDFGPAEQRVVDLLRPRLQADGLYFVAVDIVGGKVLEVNVYTPGGVRACRELYDFDPSDAVVRDLERQVEVRRAYRKSVA